MTGIPPWIADKIATTTGLDPRLGRSARQGICPRCAAPVLRGLDEDTCAFQATADPVALTPLGELLALADDRATYQLDGKPAALTTRYPWRISNRPPSPRTTVLPEHRCGSPPLPAYDPPAPTPTRQDTDRCPF